MGVLKGNPEMGNLDSRGQEIIRSEKVPEDQGVMALEESAERGGAF